MSENHYKKTSKAPLVILITVLVAVVAAVVCFLIFMNPGKSPQKDETTSTTQQTTAQLSSQGQSDNPNTDSNVQSSQQQTTEQGHTSSESSKPEDIVVPTISGEEQGDHFTASLSPYKAVDTITDNECSLREVFGSSYSGGEISFKSDGTFSDTLSLTSANSGAYAVEGDTIVATYTNDKNIVISVTQWNGDTPSEILINYGGYDVYFS